MAQNTCHLSRNIYWSELFFFSNYMVKHVDQCNISSATVQCNSCAHSIENDNSIRESNLADVYFFKSYNNNNILAGIVCFWYTNLFENAYKCAIATISKYFTFAFQFSDAIYCSYCLLIVLKMVFLSTWRLFRVHKNWKSFKFFLNEY